MNTEAQPLLAVENLTRHFPVMQGVFRREVGSVKAVDGLDFEIRERETLGLVGESGCGKSTAGRVILRLHPATAGRILFRGTDITSLEGEALRRLRPRMQMIFQDPQDSLNPRMTVGSIVGEPLREHGVAAGAALRERVEALLDAVGLDPAFANRYPHEFSGGQRQRIGVARALALNPEFVVCDEPIAALDVSIQAQVVNLLKELQERLGLTYLFISHDLRMVRHVADRVAVMYLGRLVELGETSGIFERPRHPYTETLLRSILTPDPALGLPPGPFDGEFPDPLDPPSGCRFHPRCPEAMDICGRDAPGALSDSSGLVECHLYNGKSHDR